MLVPFPGCGTKAFNEGRGGNGLVVQGGGFEGARDVKGLFCG